MNPLKPIYDLCNTGTGKEKLKNLPDFPRYVDVELTNTCNLKCNLCPTGMGTVKRLKGFMTEEIWHKILDELAEHKTAVRFVRWGEPTLHPRLYDWISEAKEKGLLTHINTNGVLLDIEEVLDCGLDSIKFSAHLPYIKEAGQEFMKLMVFFWDRLGRFKKPYPHIKYKEYTKMRDLTKPVSEHSQCPEVFDKLSIDWDGKVTACCGDYDRIMTVGDVKESTLKEIWLSEKMGYYRKMLADFRHDELPLCRCCK